MLNTPTMEKIKEMKFHGFARALEEQIEDPQFHTLGFDERLALLVEREFYERENRRLKLRLQQARLRQNACMQDIDYSIRRGLDISLLKSLGTCGWIRDHLNILMTGPTGVGKSFIACALAHSACLHGMKVRYVRLPRLFEELNLARGSGHYAKTMNALAKCHLIILDDWGLAPLNDSQRRDLLEILDDRHGVSSTIAISQFPVEHWHETIGDPTLADAILDRLIHNAHNLNMKGESMRKKKSKLNKSSKESID